LSVACLTALANLGCGSNDATPQPPSPVPSSEAGIANITVSSGTMQPAFNPNVNRYLVNFGHLYVPQTMDVTVTLKDTKARLLINGTERQSGSAVPMTLNAGENRVTIATLAEDGVANDTVFLAIPKPDRANTRVWALNAMGGVAVDDTVLTLTDAGGAVLESNVPLPKDKNGSLVFALDPNKKYNIYANGKGTAQACFANFHPGMELDENGEASVALYCRANMAMNYPAEAPIITDISFASSNAANADWKTMPNDSTYRGLKSNVAAVKITAVSKCAISETYAGMAYPIYINWDTPAYAASYISDGRAQMENSTPITRDGSRYFQSTWRFDLPSQNSIANQDHMLSVVVFDVAENRTEQRVYLKLVDSGANLPNDEDLQLLAPTITAISSQTYGITTASWAGRDPQGPSDPIDADGVRPIDEYGASAAMLISFDTKKSTGFAPPIRGFEVWRSLGDDKHFQKIHTTQYASTSTGTSGVHQFDDRAVPSDLTDTTAYYTIRLFNGNPANNGYSLFSNVLPGRLLPPFTTMLSAPAHGSVSNKVWPTFEFDITNPALLAKGATDRLRFTLYVKDIYYNIPIIKVHFRVNLNELDESGRPKVYWTNVDGEIQGPATFVRLNGSKVAIDTDNDVFEEASYISSLLTGRYYDWYMQPGATYQWGIFGADGGQISSSAGLGTMTNSALNAAHFYRQYEVPAGSPAGVQSFAYSFGSNAMYGLTSPNGLFTLTIDTDAK